MPDEKIYRVYRDEDGGEPGGVFCDVDVLNDAGQRRRIYALVHLAHHSPTGFEYGYGGSGPADLALSILRDHFGEQVYPAQLVTGEHQCWRHHQRFKADWLARVPRRMLTFSISTTAITTWLEQLDITEQVKEN